MKALIKDLDEVAVPPKARRVEVTMAIEGKTLIIETPAGTMEVLNFKKSAIGEEPARFNGHVPKTWMKS